MKIEPIRPTAPSHRLELTEDELRVLRNIVGALSGTALKSHTIGENKTYKECDLQIHTDIYETLSEYYDR